MQYPFASVALSEVPPAAATAPRLASHFQPIVSLSHQRTVGSEALLRGTDAQGLPVSPLALFSGLDAAAEEALDRRAVDLHMRRFAALRHGHAGHHWLFLNVRPATFLTMMAQSPQMPCESMTALGCAPGDLVIEVTEESVAGSERLEEASRAARAAGCLLALDDFGAGHSNFDRVWRLQPDIVKLDRSLVQRGAQQAHAARVIAQMVSLLHECGSLVLMEGIETPDEAHLALDCDVDLVQGYLFGRPQPVLTGDAEASAQLAALWQQFHSRRGHALQADRARLAPYLQAIEAAGAALGQGLPMAVACAGFLQLPAAQLCYELDEHGVQREDSVQADPGGVDERRRFTPLHDAVHACWARRPYFLRAVEGPGAVQTTRPYLSMRGSGMCVTVSIAVRHGDVSRVLCGDLAWER